MAEEKLQAGLFSDEIVLQLSTKSAVNDYGEKTNSWNDSYLTFWGKIEYLSGSSDVKNDVEQKIQKLRITGNYVDLQVLLLTPEDLYRLYVPNQGMSPYPVSSYYYITEVKPIGFRNREFIEIECKGRN